MIRINKRWILSCVAFLLTLGTIGFITGSPGQARISPPALGLPIACSLGKDCYVMHYVDRDPSPKLIDFGCGRQTYDGHNGTDVGIADLQQMATGVPVVAVADGTVLRTRDQVTDRLVADQTTKDATQGQECGNGLVIDHGDGWSTQYCHLRQNSLRVRPGTAIKQGTVLGLVGSSGLASFPHVHLTVRYQGKVVDPFVGLNDRPDCSIARQPLWANALKYEPTGLIRAGFAAQVPKQLELWQGKFHDRTLPANIPALVFWVHSYGVLAGDTEQWQLQNPQGKIVIDRRKVLERSFRSFVSYTGQSQVAPGQWQGEYQLIRNNRTIFKVNRSVVVS